MTYELELVMLALKAFVILVGASVLCIIVFGVTLFGLCFTYRCFAISKEDIREEHSETEG